MTNSPEIQANIDFINQLYEKGTEQTIRNAVPYPGKLYYCFGKCHLLAVTKNAILIHVNDEKRKEREAKARQFHAFLRG